MILARIYKFIYQLIFLILKYYKLKMSPFIAELIGTAVLLFLGTGVVSNVSLNNTKAFGSSPTGKWILITTAWGISRIFWCNCFWNL